MDRAEAVLFAVDHHVADHLPADAVSDSHPADSENATAHGLFRP